MLKPITYGYYLHHQGKLAIEGYNKAIEAFSKNISIKPDYAEAYNNLGIALKIKEFHRGFQQSYFNQA